MIALESPLIVETDADVRAADLDSRVNRLDADLTVTSTDYVFRASAVLVRELASPEAAPARASLTRRLSGRTPYALALDPPSHLPMLYAITSDSLVALPPAEAHNAIGALRQDDLSKLIDASRERCLYEQDPNVHYEAPSGVHCSSFVRVGDVVHDQRSLARMCFWLAGHVANADVVLADTWSIALPVMQSLSAVGSRASFDALASHPSYDPRAARIAIERLLRSAHTGARIVCVISVTSSGRYAQIVKELFAEQGHDPADVHVLGLYRLRRGSAHIDSLCELDLEPGNYAPHECPLCEKGVRVVSLHPGLYYAKQFAYESVMLRREFLDLGAAERRFISDGSPPIAPDAPPPATDESFLARNHGVDGLLTVHRDDPTGRHHAFYVDAEVLQSTAAFAVRLERCLSTFEAADLVLSWPDPASQQLAAMVADRLSAAREVVRSVGEIRAPSGRATTARRVAFVQSVVVNGQRLDAVNRALRERSASVPVAEANFVVGLARPTCERAWTRLNIMLTSKMPERRSRLVAVEWCALPNWDAPVCPWCAEYDFLCRVAGAMADPPAWLLQRIAALTNRKRGVSEPLWTLPGAPMPAIGAESPLAPAGTPALEVLFRIVTALQRLRNAEDPKMRLDPGPPTFRIFAADNLKNYSEGLLNAALMRAVQRTEWARTSQLSLWAEVADLAGNDRDVVLGELLLAVARGSFGRAAFDELRGDYERHLDDHHSSFSEALVLG